MHSCSPLVNSINDESILVDRINRDRKSTRLNSSHSQISYAVFCLKKKKKTEQDVPIQYNFPYPTSHSPFSPDTQYRPNPSTVQILLPTLTSFCDAFL